MYSLYLTCEQDEKDRISAELWEAGTEGIQELHCPDSDCVGLKAVFGTNASRPFLLKQFAALSPAWSAEPAADWAALTRQAWPGRVVGRKLFLAPPWTVEPTPSGRLRLVHNPGLACGTGEHPCTQLALEALERSVEPGATVADIGTGSGMLAIAAVLLGAGRVAGVDPDYAALQVARDNFAANAVRADLAAGSADCLAGESFGIVVANVSATVLLSIADDLLRIVVPSGALILTGFEQSEARVISEVFRPVDRRERSGWSCLISRLF